MLLSTNGQSLGVLRENISSTNIIPTFLVLLADFKCSTLPSTICLNINMNATLVALGIKIRMAIN